MKPQVQWQMVLMTIGLGISLGISLGMFDAKMREPALSLETAYLIAESFLGRNW